jgi:membrane associated rhomboid family serine protease
LFVELAVVANAAQIRRTITHNSLRTITAAAVIVSAAGYSSIISLYNYIFASDYVFTTRMFPQLWRLFTAFLITKPKFGILLDPYFLYQYGSSIERESPRFPQPGDFFVYTMFVGSVIVVSTTCNYIPRPPPYIERRIDTTVCAATSVTQITSAYLPAQPVISS